jgi:hypothetical protein
VGGHQAKFGWMQPTSRDVKMSVRGETEGTEGWPWRSQQSSATGLCPCSCPTRADARGAWGLTAPTHAVRAVFPAPAQLSKKAMPAHCPSSAAVSTVYAHAALRLQPLVTVTQCANDFMLVLTRLRFQRRVMRGPLSR